MKLFGYTNEAGVIEGAGPNVLAEVTLCASPHELRQMAKFLQYCAGEMERLGARYDHVHLGDHMKEFDQTSPHFVVFPAV